MNLLKTTGPALLAGVALCLGGPAVAATYTAGVLAVSNTINAGGPRDTTNVSGPAPTALLTANSSITESAGPPQFGLAVGAGASTASAQAGQGVLDLFVSGNAQQTNVPFSASMVGRGTASSNARFQDSFVVRCSGLAACADGQMGSMTVGFLVLGNSAGSGAITTTGVRYNGGWSGYAQWAAGLNMTALSPMGLVGAASWAGGQTLRDSESGGSIGEYNISYPFAEFGLKTVTFNFVFGGTIFVDMLTMASADAAVGYDSSGSTSQAAFQTLLRAGWGGVLQMTGAGGASLAGASVLSALSADTGVDYLRSQVSPVPEPATAGSLAGGMLLLALLRLRRGRHSG